VAFTDDIANARFKEWAIEGHHPAIRAHPVISDEMRLRVFQAILQLMPSIKKYQLDKASA